MNATEIRMLQIQLTRMGYNPGNPDGIWGARTRSALNQALADLGSHMADSVHSDHELMAGMRLAWGKKVSEKFKSHVINISQELKLPWEDGANWLMACMAFETAKTFSPSIKNPNSSGTGLIQFMDATARAMNTTTRKLASMTAEDQLNIFVRQYFYPYRGKMKNLSDVYMAILWPKAIGQAEEYVMWKKDLSGSRAYAVNKYLDRNDDGVVTKREAAARVHEFLAEGLSEKWYG